MSYTEDCAAGPEHAAADVDLVHRLSDAASRLAGHIAGPLRRVSVQAGGAAVELEWDGSGRASVGSLPAPSLPPAPEPADAEPGEQLTVRSPMVGTFYYAPAPGEPPFVSIGGTVEPDTVVGIVEAMKLMNHITAEHAGVVRGVLVPDGQPVEFEQPLILLDPVPEPDWRQR